MKTKALSKGDGSHYGWLIYCRGCDEHHVFDDRWTFNGDTEKPTFTPSLLVNGNAQHHNPTAPRCHSFVTDGKMQYLSDCTHSMAGETVDLPDIED